MSMMVSPISVSNVRFTANEGVNILERPGAFSKAPAGNDAAAVVADTDKPKKKHTALKVLGGLVVVAAGLVALNKTKVLKVIDDIALKDAKFMEKVGHYLGKAGEFIAKYTYDPVAGLCGKWFGKKGAEAVAEGTEAASRIV